MTTKETTQPVEIISVLKDLSRLLCRASLTVDDVRQKLVKLGVNAAVEPAPGQDAPAFVRLELPAGSHLTLETLAHEFGPYKQLPSMHRGKAIKYIYYVDLPEMPFVCALIADQRRGASTVETVTVRRDVRLK